MKPFTLLHHTLSGIGLLLAGCSTYTGRPAAALDPAPVTTKYSVQRDQVITPEDWPKQLLADVYVPEGAGPFPGVLVIHGGSWQSGDRDQVEGIAQRLAKRGYVAVNTQYRFAPDYIFPAALQDVQLALRWMKANAARYRMRPERLGGFGYSAGAHLTALLGTLSPGDALYAEPRLAAVVVGGTPSDLTKFPGGTIVPAFLGTRLQQNRETFRLASPVSYVSKDDPPFFIYHGGMDTLVPVDHATDLKKTLDDAGVPAELYILHGRGHITAFLTDGAAVEKAIGFLDRYLR